MKIPLPVINPAFDIRGVSVQVTAAPWGLVRKLIVAETMDEQGDASADIVRTCCTVAGSPIDPDQLLPDDIAQLSKIAMSDKSKDADFTTPPAGCVIDGAESPT